MRPGMEISLKLREAGYTIINHFHDQTAKGVRHKVEVAKQRAIILDATEGWTDKNWVDMRAEADNVMKIAQQIVPEAKRLYFRGMSYWIVAFSFKEVR